MDRKVILITGGSSGIGHEAARQLARIGHRVYAAARRTERMEDLREEGVVPIHMDVTSSEEIGRVVEEIIAAEGRIDALVNNAGFGWFGPIENVEIEDARQQMEVNLFGLAELCRKVLPIMREQGGGRIVNISSIAGKMVLYFGGWYHVSKYAVEAFSDALRIEGAPFNIKVSIIEPGAILTEWGGIAARHLEESAGGSAYEADAMGEAALLRKAYSMKVLPGPEVVAKKIVRAVERKRPRARYRCGMGARILPAIHAVLPAKWWDAIMRKSVKAARRWLI